MNINIPETGFLCIPGVILADVSAKFNSTGMTGIQQESVGHH